MHHVVQSFDHVRRLFGFKRVEVPVLEPTSVFSRSLGETTDVVSKEMYSFDDRGGDSVTLRPEFTAGIARAYLSEGWQQFAPLKVATHGPAFRYERPQKGRFRQFHQLDAEILGAGEPAADVELLCFADLLLKELGISEGITLQLNTLGDRETRASWRAALIDYFSAHRNDLSDESRERLDKNPLRILDSKDPRDKAIAAGSPTIDDYLTNEASDFFAAVTTGLDASGVAWQRAASLVRGLDYYRHTAFEFVTDRLGAQGTVLGGGRYDGLIENLGGAHTPAVGWAAGIERLGMMIDRPWREGPEFVLAPMGQAAENFCTGFIMDLRRRGVHCDMAYRGNLKKRLQKADAAMAGFAILVGDDELASGEVTVRSLKSGEQARRKVAEILEGPPGGRTFALVALTRDLQGLPREG